MREVLISYDIHAPDDAAQAAVARVLAGLGLYDRIGVNAVPLPACTAVGFTSRSVEQVRSLFLDGVRREGLGVSRVIVAELAEWAAVQQPV